MYLLMPRTWLLVAITRRTLLLLLLLTPGPLSPLIFIARIRCIPSQWLHANVGSLHRLMAPILRGKQSYGESYRLECFQRTYSDKDGANAEESALVRCWGVAWVLVLRSREGVGGGQEVRVVRVGVMKEDRERDHFETNEKSRNANI